MYTISFYLCFPEHVVHILQLIPEYLNLILFTALLRKQRTFFCCNSFINKTDLVVACK